MGHVRESKMVCLAVDILVRLIPQGRRDAWAKHKDLDPLEAKVMYVDALIKVLIMLSWPYLERTRYSVFLHRFCENIPTRLSRGISLLSSSRTTRVPLTWP